MVVDLPKDVQQAKYEYVNPAGSAIAANPPVPPDRQQVEKAIELMASAKKPLFYIGGGCVNSGPEAPAAGRIRRLTGFPCTQTLMGLGAFPASDPHCRSAWSACTAPTNPTRRCMIAT